MSESDQMPRDTQLEAVSRIAAEAKVYATFYLSLTAMGVPDNVAHTLTNSYLINTVNRLKAQTKA